MLAIHGTGCGLADFLYPQVDFSSPTFKAALSKKAGDGGLLIGQLVFAEDFERFAGKPYEEALAEITGGKPGFNLGGPALVSLVHTAQYLGSAAQVVYYGARGSDEVGSLVEEKLRLAGFNPLSENKASGGKYGKYVLKKYDGLSPRTDVLSDPTYDAGHGERLFINLVGDAGHLTEEALGEDFFKADIITFGGTALTPKIHDSLTELLSNARSSGALTVVNLVFDFRSEINHPGAKWKLGKNDDAYQFIDVLIADRDEALKTSGCASTEKALAWFLEKGCGAAVITEGAKDILYGSSGKGAFTPLPPSSLPVSAAIDEELAAHPELRGDTTGCGDNFAGGVISGIAEQLAAGKKRGALDLGAAIIPGTIAGGFACFTVGGVYYEKTPGEKREKLLSLLEKQKHNASSSLPRTKHTKYTKEGEQLPK